MNTKRFIPCPRFSEGIFRVVDLTHELSAFPGFSPRVPPPPFPHVEPFGRKDKDVGVRGKIFAHMRTEPFSFSDRTDHIATEVTLSTQNGFHIEGPYPGYLRPHIYSSLPPEFKTVPKDTASIPLAQLVNRCALLDLPAAPLEKIDLKRVKEAGRHIQTGDAVIARTGFSEKYKNDPEMYDWPHCEGGTTKWLVEEKQCLLFGTDALGIDGPFGSAGEENNHQDLMMAGGAALEGLTNLSALSENSFFLLALPLRINGTDAGIGRAVALVGNRTSFSLIDLSPLSNQGTRKITPPFDRLEPVMEKSTIMRRLKIDPFHMDNEFVDIAMYLTFNSHLGTHIETAYYAPLKGGMPSECLMDVSELPLEKCMGEAVLLRIPKMPGTLITAQDLKKVGTNIQRDDIVLIRTDYSDWHYGRRDFYDRTPGLSQDAADWLVEKKIKLVGIDTASIETQQPSRGSGPSGECHHTLYRAGIPIVENLCNLGQIYQERFFFAGLPPKVKGLEASPIRAIAIEWEE